MNSAGVVVKKCAYFGLRLANVSVICTKGGANEKKYGSCACYLRKFLYLCTRFLRNRCQGRVT